ncbi:MAG: gamma-glutamyl-gamma-aminobutyrate hydrolase family protein [Bacteroidetes bacterium]|nr:gamma-glutamyl-gamma-aminobutyrate hydrolase family protein [Bacteroidota bacterium]
MRKVGITYTGTDWKHENYVKWIMDGDSSIEVVRLSAAQSNLSEFLECDGLVLSGGIDIDPRVYGGGEEYVKRPQQWERERDNFEQLALKLAWDKGLPVLGVCRGLQLINVTLGGSLVQDLGVEGDETHENSAGVDKEHVVSVLPGTLLQEIIRKDGGRVNSAHHQAIGRLGERLVVNCRSEDGTIEGIEWAEPEGRPFLMAVQWHPERMYVNGFGDTFLYKAIRDQFIQALKK